ncbi:uncharacterized protein LOC127867935 isoform X2 [Dreissena polymorpha]|uniref:uncharacterized protein LOC127867935 isoform X2 n=1 Tax=Dreissena polymorpha TaxID=45954 RepID=UPI002264271E|nr:uncharacterized protein LOC127867935 isoform X2 [Dreissena polymorpha]
MHIYFGVFQDINNDNIHEVNLQSGEHDYSSDLSNSLDADGPKSSILRNLPGILRFLVPRHERQSIGKRNSGGADGLSIEEPSFIKKQDTCLPSAKATKEQACDRNEEFFNSAVRLRSRPLESEVLFTTNTASPSKQSNHPTVSSSKDTTSRLAGIFGGNWEFKLFFYAENEMPYSVRWDNMTGRVDLTDLKKQIGSNENIKYVWAYKVPLTEIQKSQLLLHHKFVVFETERWWWSIEKQKDGIIIPRSCKAASVEDACRNEWRNKGRARTSFGDGTMSVYELLDWLNTNGELYKKYNCFTNNCQHFAGDVSEILTTAERHNTSSLIKEDAQSRVDEDDVIPGGVPHLNIFTQECGGSTSSLERHPKSSNSSIMVNEVCSMSDRRCAMTEELSMEEPCFMNKAALSVQSAKMTNEEETKRENYVHHVFRVTHNPKKHTLNGFDTAVGKYISLQQP